MNCTSKIQPLDQGIIKAFKDKYRTHLSEFLLNQDNENGESCDLLSSLRKVDLFQVYLMLNNSRIEVSEQTMVNCWDKALKNMGNVTNAMDDNTNFDIENEDIHEVIDVDDNQFIVDYLNNASQETDNFYESDDDVNISESNTPNETKVTYREILDFLPKLEIWILEKGNGSITMFYDLRDEIYKIRKQNQLSIGDFLIRKR